MAKTKTTSGANVPHRALCSRISYLYQAAAYLSTQVQPPTPSSQDEAADCQNNNAELFKDDSRRHEPIVSDSQCANALARKMVSDLRDVSQKMQIRLSPAMKHTMCKRCDTLLVDGSTCATEVENKSKGGRKPWADTLVKKCLNCGCERRYPVNSDRQTRRPHRVMKATAGG